jgi:prevent-host-death family protein
MDIWHVKEAKARFRDLIEATRGGPQVIRRRGEDVAVVISIGDWRATQPTMTDLLLADDAKGDWLGDGSAATLALPATEPTPELLPGLARA